MLRIFMFVVALSMMFTPSQINKLKENAMFYAYNNGNEIVLTQESQDKIENLITASLKGARRLPALGVSLHDETMQAVQSGVWLRFKFAKTFEVDGMPFDDILVEIRPDMYGTNLIRGNNGRYEGRCFYVDLKHNCNELYGYLMSLPVGENKFDNNLQDIESGKATQTILQFLQEDDDMFSNRGKQAIPLKESLKH